MGGVNVGLDPRSRDRDPSQGHPPESRQLTVFQDPTWSLRVEGDRVSIVLDGAPLPQSAELGELVIHLPHVTFPFDFREGIQRFRHHRGQADSLALRVDARVVLDWLHRSSDGRLGGSAADDTLVLSGTTANGARYTVRARFLSEQGADDNEPLLMLSLYQVRVYGAVDTPWPILAGQIIDLLPQDLVLDRTLTTARLKIVRPALAWSLSGLGWKLPDLSQLFSRGVELRDGRFIARFMSDDGARSAMMQVGTEVMGEAGLRGAFERFVEDLELKRHHGQVDRLLADGQVREALAEVYRALDGPPQPGFLAERLIGICTSQPILFDEGERVCRDLLRVSPTYEPALCGLAAIAAGRGRREEAAVQLERLAACLTGPADREDATAADLTVAELLDEAAPDEARAALARVLERSPDHEEALEALIRLSEREGDLRATLPLYKRLLFAARSTHRTREAGLRLARHALQRDQPEDARVFLHVVLEAAPGDLEARLALSDVEAREGNLAEAARILEAALRGVPTTDGANTVKVIERLARLCLEDMGDPHRARRVLWRAIDLARIDAQAALTLGRLALVAGEAVLAERFLDHVAPSDPAWARGQSVVAEALLLRGESDRALDAILDVLERHPEDPDALSLIERCTPDLARRELLIHRLQQSATRAEPGLARARILNRVGQMLQSLSLGWDAIEPYEAALDEAPDAEFAGEIAGRLMTLYAGYGMWPAHQQLGGRRLMRVKAPEQRVPLLIELGRAALIELGDATVARDRLAEAVALSPRQLTGLRLLRNALEELHQGLALVKVLMRLESLEPEAEARDAIRVRLAELQLEGLNAPGQARATLGRLPEALHADPRVRRMMQQLGMAVPFGLEPAPSEAPRSPSRRSVSEAESERSPATAERWIAEAVALADQDRPEEAVALLRRVLGAAPGLTAAKELIALLTPAPPPAATPAPQTLSTVPTTPTAPLLPTPTQGLKPAPPPRSRRVLTAEFAAPPPNSVRAVVKASVAHKPAQDDVGAPGDSPPETSLIDAEAGPPDACFDLIDAEAGLIDAAAELELDDDLAGQVATADAQDQALVDAEGLASAGDYSAAAALLSALIAQDPDHLPAIELQVSVLAHTGDLSTRAQHLAHLAEFTFDADAAAAHLRELGRTYVEDLDRPDDGAKAWTRYIHWRPTDGAIFGRLLGILETQGDVDTLRTLLAQRIVNLNEAAMDGDPEAPRQGAETCARLARLETAEGRFDSALAAAMDASLAAPNDPEFLELLVNTAIDAGDSATTRSAGDRLLPMLLEGPSRDAIAARIDASQIDDSADRFE